MASEARPSVFPRVILKIFHNQCRSDNQPKGPLTINNLEQDPGAPAVPGFTPFVA